MKLEIMECQVLGLARSCLRSQEHFGGFATVALSRCSFRCSGATFLVRLIRGEINLGESPRACVANDGVEQDYRGITPTEIGHPGALVKAYALRHLEGDNDRDDRLVYRKLVYRYLIDLSG
jgi:hypothetical protein